MKTVDILTQEGIHEAVERFLNISKPIEVSKFATQYMPLDFAREFLLRRLSYPPKEAFRRTIKTFIANKDSLQDKILSHIRKAGSFCAEDLTSVLDRTPTAKEISLTTAFMATLTPENINSIFTTQYLDKHKEEV